MTLIILTLVFALFIAIFAIQNASLVAIKLLWIVTEVPLVLIILGSAFAGALVVFLIALWREFRLKRKNRAGRALGVDAKISAAKATSANPQNEESTDEIIDSRN